METTINSTSNSSQLNAVEQGASSDINISSNTDTNSTHTPLLGKRKFHKKSKSGCDHCKRRRVKCDEAKPFCANCQHMKLDCFYSPIKPRKKKTVSKKISKINNVQDSTTTDASKDYESSQVTNLNDSAYISPKSTVVTDMEDKDEKIGASPYEVSKTKKLKEKKLKVNKTKRTSTKKPAKRKNDTSHSTGLNGIPNNTKILSRQPSSSPYPFGEVLQNQNPRQPQRQQPLLIPQFMTQGGSFQSPHQSATPYSLNLSSNPSLNNQFVELPNPASPVFQSTGMTAASSFNSVFSPGRIPNPLGQQHFLNSGSAIAPPNSTSIIPVTHPIGTSFSLNPESVPLNKSRSIVSVGMNPSLSGSMSMNPGLNLGLFSPVGIGGVNYDFQELLGLKHQPTVLNVRAADAEQALANMQNQHLETLKSKNLEVKQKSTPQPYSTDNVIDDSDKRNLVAAQLNKLKSDSKTPQVSHNMMTTLSASPNLQDMINRNTTNTHMMESDSTQTYPPHIPSSNVYKQHTTQMTNKIPTANYKPTNFSGANYNTTNSPTRSNSINLFKNNNQAPPIVNQPVSSNKWSQLSNNSNLNLLDLKLFHHYCTEVWQTMVDAGISGEEIWSTDIPAMALDHPFLMHTLLAFSATHLSRTENGLDHCVSSHRIDALRLLRESILQLSDDNIDALVASAIILIMDSLANASTSNSGKTNYISPSAWIFHVRGAATIFTAVWPLPETSKFYDLISMDLSGLGNFIHQNSTTITELTCFDESIMDFYPVEVDSPYLITLAYLDQLNRYKDQSDFILRVFAFPALLDKTFLALLMSGDLGAMRVMRSYYKLLRNYTTKVMDKVWFLEGVSQILPHDVDQYSGGGGMNMMLDFLGGGLPSISTTNNMSEFII
ncbi:hypothetical protein TPHA_0C02180 [Tetrapisispora phaffii CBS 4417]|uniref:Zn(2)-C6 fungal-type domain-containing protein n=1 Tax=Tetrapisispora phaffii (strain ATCC 24235 / CBS 4417 / NBRC 1672 / NRRL Y-8282 / UCD 70-5) TaxID=1071381 RepID=G8BRJ6_TETPH|nr:hypothetical protein TPHA_0C02180 [Tetrapisispora phaffii CBS 4417]CCE62372.1 hypothetical protein TPHA_0C02180 [Tetrapisispora phaffii CBS 4417]